MVVQYPISSSKTDGIQLTVIAKGCEEVGTRNDEFSEKIPIIRCRNITAVIPLEDLPKSKQLSYIKTQIETAYNALPDETLVKSLIGETWGA